MTMYNLIEYSKNYRKARGSLWNYYKDALNNLSFNLSINNNPPTSNYNADPITNSGWFKYKNSIIGKRPNNDNNDCNTKDVEFVLPLKHLSIFWRSLDMLLIWSQHGLEILFHWYYNTSSWCWC